MRRERSALVLALLLAGCSSGSDGPHAPIDLIVDGLGITHVMAADDHDAFFGDGYAMARDRLFQMEMARRQARGTQSEIVGSSYLQSDIAARVIGFSRLGAADAALARSRHPDDAALVEAWAAGINRRIAEIKSGAAPQPYAFAQLGLVPEPWTMEDAFAIGKTIGFSISNTLDQDLLASVAQTVVPETAAHFPFLMPAYDEFIVPQPTPLIGHHTLPSASHPQRPRVSPAALDGYRPLFAVTGSNNWAVDGTHTDNGRPYVCGDPHQPVTGPPRFWPVHLSSANGSFNVIGFAFPGTPAVELGHNAHLGWTATTNFSDVMDIWDVAPDGDRKSVTLGDGAHQITAHTETIRVLDAPGQLSETQVTVEEVEGHGVLLPAAMLPVPTYLFTPNEVLFDWTGFRATGESSAYLALDRARDLDEFEAAIDGLDVGAVNFVAADMTGIDYRSHSAVPDRGDPSSHDMPWHIMQGSEAASFWSRGDLPLDELPHLRSPASGFLITANNDPFGFTADGNVADDPWYYGAFFANGARALRIRQGLESLTANGATVARADMEALQDDLHSVFADDLLPALATALAAADPTAANFADLTALGGRLAAWDRRMSVDSDAALIFLAFEWFAAQRAVSDQITSILFDSIVTKSPPYMLGVLRNIVTDRFADAARYAPDGVSALLTAALGDTATFLRGRYGSLDSGAFTLGSLSGVKFPSVLGGATDGPWSAVSGADDTIFVNESAFFDKDMVLTQMSANEMSLYRMVIGFADDGTPEATLDFQRGTSEDPASPHFADQQPDWLVGAHQPLPFARADIEAQATSTVTIK